MEDIPWTYCCNLRRGLFVRHWTSTSTRAGKPRHIPLPCVKSSRGKVRAKICQKTSRWTFAMSELSPKMVWNSFSHKKKVFFSFITKGLGPIWATVWSRFNPPDRSPTFEQNIFVFLRKTIFVRFQIWGCCFRVPQFSPLFHDDDTTNPFVNQNKTEAGYFKYLDNKIVRSFFLCALPALSISLLFSFTQFLALPFKLFWSRNCSLLP